MQRQMKYEEEIAKIFFERQGFANIIYEPKGYRTPDFLLNDEIAIEVRRLNQYLTNETKPRPLEELYYGSVNLKEYISYPRLIRLKVITFRAPAVGCLISYIKVKILFLLLLTSLLSPGSHLMTIILIISKL